MSRAVANKPNIVFIFADQLRASSVGFAGEEAVITPNLDAFTSDSALFTTAVVPQPVCTPYRASLLTGRSPFATGVILNDIPLSTDEVSIAHVCASAGYDTAYIGKWHLNGPNRPAWVPPGPPRQGFRYWAAANFDHNYHHSIYYRDDSPEPLVWEGHDAEGQVNLTIEYLEGRDRSRPFCLFLSWGPPHHPYRIVPQKYLDLYDPKDIRARANCPEPPIDDLWGYYAQITFLDEQFARLMTYIDGQGLREDTILVFTSDHGDMHGSHGVYKKQWPWDESIKVPFLLRYPPKVAAGTSIDFPIDTFDIMPTLLGLAEIEIPDTVEGRDLSPFIAGERNDPPDGSLLLNPCPFSVGDPRGPDQWPTYNGMRAEYRGIRTSRYTYVRLIDRPWLLYDNQEDPFQLENRIDDAALRSLRNDLEGLMQNKMRRIGDSFEPKEVYYERYALEIDDRGKVKDIIENPYDRLG